MKNFNLEVPRNNGDVVLRPYQRDAISAITNAFNSNLNRVLIHAATGTGKTVIVVELNKELKAENTKKVTLFLAHTEELVEQAANRFKNSNPELIVDIEQAKKRACPDAQVICASVPTLARGTRLKDRDIDLIILDECHHAPADTFKRTLERFGCFDERKTKLVGITATPHRADNKDLKDIFEKQVFRYDIKDGMCDGYLVDIRGYRVKTTTSIDAVSSRNGDFNLQELAEAVDNENRTRQILSKWYGIAKERRTLCFCASTTHADNVAKLFTDAGFKAAAVHGAMEDNRREVIEKFRAGEIQIVTAVNMFTEGIDIPEIDCILMFRPIKSWTFYVQALGRGTRLAPGKTDLIVIDAVDITKRHKLVNVPAILNLPPDLDLEGNSLLDAFRMLERVTTSEEIIKEKAPATYTELTVILERIDLLGIREIPEEVRLNSTLNWSRTRTGEYKLQGPNSSLARLVLNDIGEWEFKILTDKNNETDIAIYESSELPPFREVDDYLKGIWSSYLTLLISTAGWRNDPPTDKQIFFLRQYGYNAESMTKGAASNLITAIKTNNIPPVLEPKKKRRYIPRTYKSK